ncbi:MAG: endonuclease MutS2 [Firmicutes bacterium]|nr:endonuclease MutS2 [Bacillota bacterium]
MDQRTLERLEYHKVLDMLAKRTSFSLSREWAKELRPETSLGAVSQAQEATSQARDLLDKVGEVATGGLKDIRDHLHQIELGRLISPADFLDLRDCLEALTGLGRYFRDLPEEYPVFRDFGRRIADFSGLVSKIIKVLDDSGEVKDTASPKLRSIRSQIKINQQRVRHKLASLISSPEYGKYLQESLITVRGERFVIPVKSEYKSSVPGIVHDRSASGATLFIEPMAVVEINNTLRELQLAEKQEVTEILKALAKAVSERGPEIREALASAGQADLLLAKGRLSQDLRCSRPDLNTGGVIELKKARHPLLCGEVIPVDIRVGSDFKILVITGPNTGGKTVTLKTVGLLTVMAQAGLHIPAAEGSKIAVFSGVHCDIGDEQSIEQNLSTFSGHISNISSILKEMEPNSLVLLDELGAGTDPQEGAALGIAILDYLLEKKCTAVVTTHYSELKTYAYANPKIENASMEFDSVSLAPTYRVILGLPGRSNALEIAERLGLPKSIINRARRARVGLKTELDEVLGEIGEELKEARRAKADAQRDLAEAQRAKRRYEELLESLEKQRKELIEEAKREARKIVAETRAQLEEAVREVREKASDEAIKSSRRTLEEVSKKVKATKAPASENEKARERKAAQLKVGDYVEIKSLQTEGVIASINKTKKEAVVQTETVRITVPFKDLVPRPGGEKGKKEQKVRPSFTKVIKDKRLSVPSEIMVRGMTVEDAWSQLDKYLDDALLAGYDSVRLIHGKGEGILRRVLRERMDNHPAVSRYEEAAYNQGGSGVTIVYLKK